LGGADGLYYYGARWYDSSLGRFAQADTIVPSPGNPQSLNRYAYGLNNPLKYVDPSGHVVWFAPMLVGAAVGAATGATLAYVGMVYSKVQGGATFQEALAVNNREAGMIAGAAAAGAITGGTFGVVGAVGGFAALGIGGSMALGAGTSVVAGQADAAVSGTVNEALDSRQSGSDFSAADAFQSARESGLGDPGRVGTDIVGGLCAGAAGYGMWKGATSGLQMAGLADWTSSTKPLPTIGYLPNTGPVVYQTHPPITIPAANAAVTGVVAPLIRRAPEATGKFVYNQVNKRIKDLRDDDN